MRLLSILLSFSLLLPLTFSCQRKNQVMNERKPVTEELVDRTFEKFCAFKRYILPMLANTLEYQYFSFYRYILQYVVEHDEYPEFEVARWYKYPLLPGMTECDIDFDY